MSSNQIHVAEDSKAHDRPAFVSIGAINEAIAHAARTGLTLIGIMPVSFYARGIYTNASGETETTIIAREGAEHDAAVKAEDLLGFSKAVFGPAKF